MTLTPEQRTYLASAPLDQGGQIAEIVANHRRNAWCIEKQQDIERQLSITSSAYLTEAQVHNLLEGLPIKPAYRVRLELSWLWLQCWDVPVGYGGGNKMGTRIVILPPFCQLETTIHEGVGHTAYGDWMYQRPDLQEALLAAVIGAAARPYDYVMKLSPAQQRIHRRLLAYVWGERNERGELFRGFIAPPNPNELFASVLSACMGRIDLLPPDLAVFYKGIVQELA